jgi:hypothetical protein
MNDPSKLPLKKCDHSVAPGSSEPCKCGTYEAQCPEYVPVGPIRIVTSNHVITKKKEKRDV